ncbi:hypothetical protein [Allorhodopirellula solitaria]|uniref:Uncharacterized protein n=1 Tax=Allorhodopirellula solitaria TaxID=2527987 RepID=A0A5C5YBQ5_9BACT|nr:hypothetical protein [Allorhodopirellula solitaria]TWT73147.1 hypothetical protein CA85_16140 [Allorhodopirellula solitaria]
MAHRIRLRKPWQRRDHLVGGECDPDHLGSEGANTVAADRVDVPDPQPEESGGQPTDRARVDRVSYVRQFHRPSGLERHDRVILEIGAVAGRISRLSINNLKISGFNDQAVDDQGLPSEGQAGLRVDLTDQLVDHNELEIHLVAASDPAGPPRLVGEVNLWIIEAG